MYCEIKNALIYYQIPTKLLDFGVNELGSFTNLQAEQKYEFFCLGNELFVDRNHSWMIKKNFLNILSCQDHNKGFTYYKN